MAWLLGTRLTAAGHTCAGVYGRNAIAAQALAGAIQAPVLESISGIPDTYDVCILTVADHAIAEVQAQVMLSKTVVLHTAGALSMHMLAAPHSAVLWPVYSITKNNLPQHRAIPVAIDASDEISLQTVTEIAQAFTDNYFRADDTQRSWLHLTAVLSNNFVNHLLAIAEQICTAQNLSFSALRPIIEQTFARIAHTSPYTVQTGPARRGDTETMQKHMALLQLHPDWQHIYSAISASVENMYKKAQND